MLHPENTGTEMDTLLLMSIYCRPQELHSRNVSGVLQVLA